MYSIETTCWTYFFFFCEWHAVPTSSTMLGFCAIPWFSVSHAITRGNTWHCPVLLRDSFGRSGVLSASSLRIFSTLNGSQKHLSWKAYVLAIILSLGMCHQAYVGLNWLLLMRISSSPILSRLKQTCWNWECSTVRWLLSVERGSYIGMLLVVLSALHQDQLPANVLWRAAEDDCHSQGRPWQVLAPGFAPAVAVIREIKQQITDPFLLFLCHTNSLPLTFK